MKRLVLLRHGQSQWNLENRFTGWTDVDLTPLQSSRYSLMDLPLSATSARNSSLILLEQDHGI